MSPEQYILKVGEQAANRLTILNNAYGPYSAQFLQTLPVKPGMHILDVGCGSGEMSLWFAKIVGPSGSVTGIDVAEQIAVAEKKAQAEKLTNTHFQALNLHDATTLKQQFDLVYCRFVLAFLKSVEKGLQIMYSLVKPGGKIACEEIECSSWMGYPHSDAYDQHINWFMKLGESRGMDFNTGPKLYHYFHELNFPLTHLSIAEPVFLTPQQKQHMVLVTQECAQGYINANIATTAEIEKLVVDLKKLVIDDNFLMAGARVFQIAATKLPVNLINPG